MGIDEAERVAADAKLLLEERELLMEELQRQQQQNKQYQQQGGSHFSIIGHRVGLFSMP